MSEEKIMRFCLLLFACLASAVGCRSATDSGIPGGSFALVQFNGEALPVDRGPAPTPSPSACRLLVDDGRLTLDSAQKRYNAYYVIHLSCDGREVHRWSSAGTYAENADGLQFTPNPTANEPSFGGTMTTDGIWVKPATDLNLKFK